MAEGLATAVASPPLSSPQLIAQSGVSLIEVLHPDSESCHWSNSRKTCRRWQTLPSFGGWTG